MKKPTVVAIVQARMTSARLPGKVLSDLGGHPVLEWVTSRLLLAETLDKLLVATSNDPSDDPIERWCAQAQVECFRGSLEDVLARFAGAAEQSEADVVVRITADCPLIDADLVDLVVRKLLTDNLDYCGLAGEFPDGLDCEAISVPALQRAHAEASLPSEREHVTPYLKRSRFRFRTGTVEPFKGLDHHRWTLDHPEDLTFLRAVVANSRSGMSGLKTADILTILDGDPWLIQINAGLTRNQGYVHSGEDNWAPDVQPR